MHAVIPSLNYGDFLAATLPAWLALLPRRSIAVVTAPGDSETIAVASRHGCACMVTEAWHCDGALNKAAALDKGFAAVPVGEWCLALDSDIFPFGKMPTLCELDPNTLFSAPRFSCPTPDDLHAHITGQKQKSEFSPIRMWRKRNHPDPAGLQGYFQLWRKRPDDSFGSFPTAAKYDVAFGKSFTKRAYLQDLYVLHLGEHRRNWSGRVTPRWQEVVHA